MKKLPVTLATTGVLAALSFAALPMLPRFAPDEEPRAIGTSLDLVVDLKDDVAPAQIHAMEAQYGVSLVPNSPLNLHDNIMRLAVPRGKDAATLLAQLNHDSRVEVAETNEIYSLPEPTVLELADEPQQTYSDGKIISVNRDGQKVGVKFEDDVLSYTVTKDEPQYKLGVVNEYAMASPSSSCASPLMTSEADDDSRIAFKPNDPRFNEQWNFQTIGVEEAWKRSRGKGIVVAVIDTGVSGGKVRRGAACRDFNTTSFVDGYDFVHKDKDPYDDHGHGTHVAGTIAESTNNGEGVAGIAYEASIMPLKVLSAQGSGNSADIADAIRFAADNGANVINMSLGSSLPSEVIHKAVQYAAKKGVVIVCAAGNSFGGSVGYPAAYKECIAVSATGPSGNIAKYSSYGKEVALAAPGGDMIDSGDPADGILQNTVMNGKDDYFAFNGTSMASPHVAGVAALIMAQGQKDPARVREILTKTAAPKGDAIRYGAGILSADKATARAEQLGGIKLRQVLLPFLGVMFFLVGMRQMNVRLRFAMAAALAVGFFGPDLFTQWVGANSVWNLVGCSAALPVLAYVLLRRGVAVKVAGTLGLGMAVNLYANWHNGTLPFTTDVFGSTPALWFIVNLTVALGVGILAARTVRAKG